MTQRLAVGALAEFVHRRGDLHARLDGRTRAEEGIKKLDDSPDTASIRRKVGGLPPQLSIFELGFAGKGQISAGALEHPPLKELIDSGDIEIVEGGGAKNTDTDRLPRGAPARQPGGGGGDVHYTGDR